MLCTTHCKQNEYTWDVLILWACTCLTVAATACGCLTALTVTVLVVVAVMVLSITALAGVVLPGGVYTVAPSAFTLYTVAVAAVNAVVAEVLL
jgi:hypothetical protein